MTDNHPITPPQWQVDAWCKQALAMGADVDAVFLEAARWGADQELEACCGWLEQNCGRWELPAPLRAARRPKPLSLAKQGCDALDTYIYGNPNHKDKERTYNTIRAALERMKELEKGNE